jgi:Fe-S-cluster-containing hydrogenase component 2
MGRGKKSAGLFAKTSKYSQVIAVVGEECKGCSRCAVICPEDAITITVDNPDYINQCINRIGAYVDIS